MTDGTIRAAPRAPMSAIGRLLRVRPGEGRAVGSLVALMFVTCAGLTVGESGASALFFDRIGPDALPEMYLAQGLAGLVVMLTLTGWLSRLDRRRTYVALPLALGGIVLLERIVVATGVTWILPVLWITAALDWLLQAVFLWGAAGVVTDTRRAKRLFPLFGAGGILGSVVGGLATPSLAAAVGAENLLVVWAASLVGGAALVASVLRVRLARRYRPRRRRAAPGSPARDLARTLSFVRRSPLLAWMTAAAVLLAVSFSSLYLPFAQAATARFPDPEELAGFLGSYWAVATGGAFLASILLANRLLAWIGATAVVLVLPILYVGAFGALVASSALATVALGRFVVLVWLQGVTSPAWETLVNVVPEDRRDQVRAFLGGGPAQVGTAIAGVVTLAGEGALAPTQLAAIGLVTSAATVVVAWRIRGAYGGALADALRAGRPRVFERSVAEGPPVLIDVDAQAIELALDAGTDPDPRVRRLAVELLGHRGTDARIRSALVERTRDEDPLVRARAIRALADANPTHGAIAAAFADVDAEVRLAAVEALGMADAEERGRLATHLRDPDASVAAAASVALLDGEHHDAAEERLRELMSEPDEHVREVAVRRLAGARGSSAAVASLTAALADRSVVVRAQALRSLATVDPAAAVSPAIETLAAGERSTRDVAFETLRGIELSAHAPALARLVDASSAEALRDRALADSIPLDGEELDLLRSSLLERGRGRAAVAILGAAATSGRGDDVLDVVENLESRAPGQVANALEILEAGPGADVIRPLVALWEPATAPSAPHDDWLEAALDDPDPTIRAFADLVRTARAHTGGATMSRTRASVSPAERVLVLRRIPLFAELTPADLWSVAEIAEERAFGDGAVIATEGEIGDELHIVLGGTIAVVRGEGAREATVARRGEGEVVGEMSILTNAPRVASLVAEGDVRTLRIGRREFESMLRERPDVAVATMRVLAERLAALTGELEAGRGGA